MALQICAQFGRGISLYKNSQLSSDGNALIKFCHFNDFRERLDHFFQFTSFERRKIADCHSFNESRYCWNGVHCCAHRRKCKLGCLFEVEKVDPNKPKSLYIVTNPAVVREARMKSESNSNSKRSVAAPLAPCALDTVFDKPDWRDELLGNVTVLDIVTKVLERIVRGVQPLSRGIIFFAEGAWGCWVNQPRRATTPKYRAGHC
jgi:hypothetical protein